MKRLSGARWFWVLIGVALFGVIGVLTRSSIGRGEEERRAQRAEGFPPLIVAVNDDQLEEVRRLLATEENVNGMFGREKDRPLHFARSGEMVRLLLEAGAERDALNDQKETPLHTVRFPGAAEALLVAGADPKALDEIRETPLHDVPNEELVELLVAWGADVNAVDHHRRTPLMAAQNGGVVEALLRHGADAAKRDSYGKNAMHYVSDGKSVRLLKRAGLSVRDKTRDGMEPLHSAKSGAVVKALLAAGADLDVKDRRGYSAWSHATKLDVLRALYKKGNEKDSHKLTQSFSWRRHDVVVFLLGKGAELPSNSRYWRNANEPAVLRALLKAGADPKTLRLAGVADLETARWLISKGALVNPQAEDMLGWPLAESPSGEIAHLLLKEGASTSPRPLRNPGEKPATVMHAALIPMPPAFKNAPAELIELLVPFTDLKERNYLSLCGTVAQVKVLLKAGADPNLVVGDELSALIRTAEDNRGGDCLERIQLLLESGADPKSKGYHGRSLLHMLSGYAFFPEGLKGIRMLLKLGVDVNARDNNGGTPLSYAAGSWSDPTLLEKLELLVAEGADVNARDNSLSTPLHQLVMSHIREPKRHFAAIQWMLENGADPGLADNQGRLPADFTRDAAVLKLLKGAKF